MTSPDTDDARSASRAAARRAAADGQDPSWFDQALLPSAPVVPDPAAASPSAATGPAATSPVSVPSTPSALPPLPADDEEFLDETWTAPRRVNRLTVLLGVGIVAAAGFAGGAWAQRSHDAGLTPTASAFGAAGRTGGQFPSGFPSGGFGGFGQGGAGAGTGAGVGTAGGAAGSGSGAAGSGAAGAGGAGGAAGSGQAAGVPVVVGTVDSVSGTTVTVKNFGGQTVVVHVSDTTSVTTVGLNGLKAGATVAVFGTKAADGSVTATSIVSRKAG